MLESMRQEKEMLKQMMERERTLKEQALGQLTVQAAETPRTPDERKQQISEQEQVRLNGNIPFLHNVLLRRSCKL